MHKNCPTFIDIKLVINKKIAAYSALKVSI